MIACVFVWLSIRERGILVKRRWPEHFYNFLLVFFLPYPLTNLFLFTGKLTQILVTCLKIESGHFHFLLLTAILLGPFSPFFSPSRKPILPPSLLTPSIFSTFLKLKMCRGLGFGASLFWSCNKIHSLTHKFSFCLSFFSLSTHPPIYTPPHTPGQGNHTTVYKAFLLHYVWTIPYMCSTSVGAQYL